MNIDAALGVIGDAVTALRQGDLLQTSAVFSEDFILLGEASDLDSIAFITLITEVEDRLFLATGKKLFIALTNIKNFDPDKPEFTAGTLAAHLVDLANGSAG